MSANPPTRLPNNRLRTYHDMPLLPAKKYHDIHDTHFLPGKQLRDIRDMHHPYVASKLRQSLLLPTEVGMAERTYSIDELAAECGINARTLRSWVTSKALPKPVGQGRAARYSAGHLLRARVIAQLRQRGESLQAIRGRIASLSPAQLNVLLTAPREVDSAQQPPPAPTYPFAQWQMVQLMPGMALMVHSDGGPALRRIADEIYRHYNISTRV